MPLILYKRKLKMKPAIPFIALLSLGGYAFMKQPKFGRSPKGKRRDRIRNSPNFRDGQFQNLSPTPSFTEGANYFTVLKKFLLDKDEKSTPREPLPSLHTNLKKLRIDEDVLIWFGHSSYFLQLNGKTFLVDPVLSGSASPFSFTTKAFAGTDRYSAEHLPEIDYLFITHDHWDHLDYESIISLKPKIKKVITGLGTGEHLESWGYDPEHIIEEDWGQEIALEPGFMAHTVPARHFSGRGFKRNSILWTSFVLQTPSYRIFIGGDSGYDSHFSRAGEKFGPFDLAILENGQYNKHWKYIHMMPEEVLLAAKELQAKRLFTVHNSKFSLSTHAWDAPLKAVDALRGGGSLQLMTPLIGEKVDLKKKDQTFSRWWEKVS